MAKEMKNDILIEMALYYIDHTISMNELAKKFGFTKSVVVRYLEGNYDIRLSSSLQELVSAKAAENWAAGKSTSGNAGKTKLKKSAVLNAACSYLKGKKSLTQIADELGVSRGTLYNNMFNPDIVGKDVYEALKEKNESGRRK